MSKSTLTPMDPLSDQFRDWLLTPGFRRMVGTTLHHTWSPSAAQYRGRDSIVAIRNYHIGKNWSDIAAQAYACPDGKVITARPLDAYNLCHAAIPKNFPVEAELWAAAKKHCPSEPRMFPNRLCFGLETVANFDHERPYGDGLAAHSFETAMRVLTTVHQVFNIPPEMLFFHRDGEYKTCPGNLLQRHEVRAELARRLGGQAAPEVRAVKVVLDGEVIDCKPQWMGDRITVEAAPLLAAMGLPTDNPAVHAETGRAYLRELSQYAPGWEFVYRDMPQGPRVYVKDVTP